MTFTRVDTTLISQGTKCAAWLYMPGGVSKPPSPSLEHWTRSTATAWRCGAPPSAVLT